MWKVNRKYNDGYEVWTAETWEFNTLEEAEAFREQLEDKEVNPFRDVWFEVEYEHPYD